ncbi:hypothetical protein BGX26_006692 [Mortierella sp. AD094]|nr:hypothetical protein BGX26_006692 [Mortierella sp. AD094]
MSNYPPPPGKPFEEQPHYQHPPPPPLINKAATLPPTMDGSYMTGVNAGIGYPGAMSGSPADFLDPTQPRPNDILPLHPAIIQQRQIAATLPPCPGGGYHELRKRHIRVTSKWSEEDLPVTTRTNKFALQCLYSALVFKTGTCLPVTCFPIVCCCVKHETVCINCQEKFDVDLPRVQ